MQLRSTICALATPPGEGGIAVVRLSGPDAYPIAAKVFAPIHKEKSVLEAKGYTALFGHYLLDGQEMDETVALFYRAPAATPARTWWSFRSTGAAPWRTGCSRR